MTLSYFFFFSPFKIYSRENFSFLIVNVWESVLRTSINVLIVFLKGSTYEFSLHLVWVNRGSPFFIIKKDNKELYLERILIVSQNTVYFFQSVLFRPLAYDYRQSRKSLE